MAKTNKQNRLGDLEVGKVSLGEKKLKYRVGQK